MNESTAHDESRTAAATPPADRNGSVTAPKTKAEFRRRNGRRLDLIDKKYREGLTLAETEELEQLQQECSAYIDAKFPPPTAHLERLREVEAELEAQRAGKKG